MQKKQITAEKEKKPSIKGENNKNHPYYLELKNLGFPKPDFMAMKDRILKRRNKLGLSQADLADMIGMKQQSYYKAERKNLQKFNFFTIEQIYNLKHALGVSYDYIFEGGDFEEKKWDFPESPLKLNFVMLKKRIIYKRVTLDLLQVHVADLIGMSNENYHSAEKTVGFKSSFTTEQIYKLKHVLGASYDYIFEGNGAEEMTVDSKKGSKENIKMKEEIIHLKETVKSQEEKINNLQNFNNTLMDLNKILQEQIKKGY